MKKKIALFSLFVLFSLPIFAQNIFTAAKTNDIPGIQFLLANGSHVNARDAKGETPLIVAVQNGQLRAAKLLLELDADINMQDKAGNTALIVAVNAGNTALVKALLARGADAKITDKTKKNAMDYAKASNMADILNLLNNNNI
jgi:ankyrin repeat protein